MEVFYSPSLALTAGNRRKYFVKTALSIRVSPHEGIIRPRSKGRKREMAEWRLRFSSSHRFLSQIGRKRFVSRGPLSTFSR